MNIISIKWVFQIKYYKDGTIERYKARLVAKGFQQHAGVDYFHTFSLVIKPLTLRIVFSIAVTKGWKIQQVNIDNAFLNGHLKETVYIEQPEGFIDQSKPTHVCKLSKAPLMHTHLNPKTNDLHPSTKLKPSKPPPPTTSLTKLPYFDSITLTHKLSFF